MAIAIYVRQSVNRKNSISIETQISLCKAKCSRREKIVVYEDKGFSGKDMRRPAFQNMMRDIENKKIKKIIVYRLDRLSRNVEDFNWICNNLAYYKVSLCSVSERLDIILPVEKVMIYRAAIFAQLECEIISKRVTDNYYERAKRGSWLGGPASAQVIGKRKASNRKYRKLEEYTIVLTNFAGVISSEVWLACQNKLKRNSRK